MTLFDEFLLREKLSKSLAASEMYKARADAGLARIAKLEADTEALFEEALTHISGLRAAAAKPSGEEQDAA
jgi:hypothetical protein